MKIHRFYLQLFSVIVFFFCANAEAETLKTVVTLSNMSQHNVIYYTEDYYGSDKLNPGIPVSSASSSIEFVQSTDKSKDTCPITYNFFVKKFNNGPVLCTFDATIDTCHPNLSVTNLINNQPSFSGGSTDICNVDTKNFTNNASAQLSIRVTSKPVQ